MTRDRLAALGVSAVIYPSAALFAAVGGVTRAMQALSRDGDFAAVEDELCALDDYYEVVGLQRYNDFERDCDEAAAKTVAKNKPTAAE